MLKDFYSNNNAFDCPHCNVTFLMRDNGQPYIISFSLDSHQIDLDYSTHDLATRLFEIVHEGYSQPKYVLILKLPHIIPIDPARKDYWLQKLLKLVVFS